MESRLVDFAPIAPHGKMLCRVEEVAIMLSIGRTAAWELVRKHKIRSVKIGHTRRVPMSAVHEYIDKLLDASEVA